MDGNHRRIKSTGLLIGVDNMKENMKVKYRGIFGHENVMTEDDDMMLGQTSSSTVKNRGAKDPHAICLQGLLGNHRICLHGSGWGNSLYSILYHLVMTNSD